MLKLCRLVLLASLLPSLALAQAYPPATTPYDLHYLDNGADGSGAALTTIASTPYKFARSVLIRIGNVTGDTNLFLPDQSSNPSFFDAFYVGPSGNRAGIYYTNTSGANNAVEVHGTLPTGAYWLEFVQDASGNLNVGFSTDRGHTYTSLGPTATGFGMPAAHPGTPFQIGAKGNPAHTRFDGAVYAYDNISTVSVSFDGLATGQTSIPAFPWGAATLTGNATIK